MRKIKSLLFSQTSKDAAISLGGSGVVALSGMVFTILLARSLEPERFGVYSSLAALVGIASTLGDLGIGSALVHFLPKLPNKRQVLVATSFWFQAVIALLFSILVSLASLFNHSLVPGSIPLHFIIAGLLTGVYVVNQYSISLLKAEKKFYQASLVQVIDSLAKLSLVSVFFFNYQLTIGLALASNIISVILSTTYGLKQEHKKLPLIFPKVYLKKIFSFAKWIGLSRVFGVAVSRIDILLLNLIHSSFAAGIFAAASRVGLVFALIVSSLGSVVSPRFSAFTKRSETIAYLKKLFLLVSLISIVMLLMVILAKPIILLVFGIKYQEAIPVFQVLTIALIPFLFSIITSTPIIYTYNQPSFFAKITILQTVTLVTLDILLIPSLGAFAPAISLGVSNVLILLLGGLRLRKLLQKNV